MFAQFTQPSKSALGILFFTLLVLFWLLGRFSAAPSSTDIPNVIVDTKTCSTPATNNSDTFVAFIIDRGMATPLLDTLCKNATIGRQFGQVKVRWSHSDEDVIQYVGKGIADLALVKENFMNAFATHSTHGYEVVAHYQDYTTYLISMKEKPQINKQYLWGKRIGLLDYPSSRSGHIVPKRMLKELDIKDTDINIVYANSHWALRELLSSGKVDIISSYWHEKDDERFSANYITPIEANISGSKWYLKMETANTDLLCAVQASLRSLAESTTSAYYSTLTLSSACPSASAQQQGSGND